MTLPTRGQLEPGMMTLFAALWVVKAQETPCDQPLAARHRRGPLSSKPHLDREGGARPLVILSPASSAIEVRTVVGRVPAALTAFRAALAPVRNLVLLLPSPDPEESVRVLTERRAPPLRYIAGTACWPGAGQQPTILAR